MIGDLKRDTHIHNIFGKANKALVSLEEISTLEPCQLNSRPTSNLSNHWLSMPVEYGPLHISQHTKASDGPKI